MEVDACDQGIGAVLTQEGKPIAFQSKAISQKNLGWSIYEKEFLAILMAISKWRHYLSTRQFVIKMDHESLKHLLEQIISTVIQQRGLLKLLGLNYVIHYKKGRENKAADVLSRRGFEEGSNQAISTAIPEWATEVLSSYMEDQEFQRLISQLTLQSYDSVPYTYVQGMLRYKGRLYIWSSGELRQKVLK